PSLANSTRPDKCQRSARTDQPPDVLDLVCAANEARERNRQACSQFSGRWSRFAAADRRARRSREGCTLPLGQLKSLNQAADCGRVRRAPRATLEVLDPSQAQTRPFSQLLLRQPGELPVPSQ